jgi:hypothetical protein
MFERNVIIIHWNCGISHLEMIITYLEEHMHDAAGTGGALGIVEGGLMSYLRYLCLIAHSGVQHILTV